MMRLWTDFNGRTISDACHILRHDDDKMSLLDPASVQEGERVILFQDEDDFEVEAELHFGYLDALHQVTWFAVPDWKTKRLLAKET